MAELAAHTRTSQQHRRIRDMYGRFFNRRDAGKGLAVVTIRATADDTGVVHDPSGESTGIGIGRSVAGLAHRTGRQMVHRFRYRRHPGKDLAVVASRATAGNTGVVHYPRVKAGGTMAERARRSSRQVIRRLRSSSRNRETHCRGMAALTRRKACCKMGRIRRLGYRCHSNSKGFGCAHETMAN